MLDTPHPRNLGVSSHDGPQAVRKKNGLMVEIESKDTNWTRDDWTESYF